MSLRLPIIKITWIYKIKPGYNQYMSVDKLCEHFLLTYVSSGDQIIYCFVQKYSVLKTLLLKLLLPFILAAMLW
jgi:hypothetical protein